jgi:hypothetical protein
MPDNEHEEKSRSGRRHAAELTSPADLRKFFKACDLREKGREPDWEEHLKAMEESRATGRSGT